MNAIQNFAFEEHLVRVVDRNGEPWFVGKDVCGVLDIAKHHQALESLDEDERGTCIVGTPRGEQSVIVVSEPGVYRLVFRSRKPEAERFKRWLAHEVLPQIRKTGGYGPAAQPLPSDPAERERRALHMVTEARMIFGKAAAARLWVQLGLPAVPAALPDREPEQCLAHLLDAEAEGATLRDAIRAALRGNAQVAAALPAFGIRVGDGVFTVATRHPFLLRLYRPTEWQPHYRFLRRLHGAEEARVMKYGRDFTARGVELPAFYVDEDA